MIHYPHFRWIRCVCTHQQNMPRLAVEHRGWHGTGCVPWVSLQSGGAGLLRICQGWPWVVLTLELCGELSGTLPVGFSKTDAKDYVNSLYRIEFQCPGTSPWRGLIYTIDPAREKWSAFPKVTQNVLRLNLRRSLERYSSLVYGAPDMSQILCVCLGFSMRGAVAQKGVFPIVSWVFSQLGSTQQTKWTLGIESSRITPGLNLVVTHFRKRDLLNSPEAVYTFVFNT